MAEELDVLEGIQDAILHRIDREITGLHVECTKAPQMLSSSNHNGPI